MDPACFGTYDWSKGFTSPGESLGYKRHREGALRQFRPEARTLFGRITSWCMVALPFLVAAVRNTIRGWSAFADNAAISIRAFEELGSSGPLVGQFSQASPSATHVVYDAGPLQYWLLALPAHIDPRYGTMWGSAFWCIVAGVLAVEALRSVLGNWGGYGAAAAFIGVVIWLPAIAVDAVWNPYFGLTFFLAAIAAAWAALCGRLWWWPVAAFTASVAAQSHLMFAMASILLVLVTAVIGLVVTLRSPDRHFGWVVVGVLVGIGCWLAPIIQQISSRSGNLLALVSSVIGQKTLGLNFGMKALAAASFPHPIWWMAIEGYPFLPIVGAISKASSLIAGIVLTIVVAIGGATLLLRRRYVFALCTVTFVCAVSLIVTISGIMSNKVLTIGYIDIIMYPVGVLCWVTAIAIIGIAAQLIVSRSSHGSIRGLENAETRGLCHVRSRATGIRSWRGVLGDNSPIPRWGVRIGSVCIILALGIMLMLSLAEQAADSSTILPWASMREVPHLASSVEQELGGIPRPVLISVDTSSEKGVGYLEDVTLGVAWAMRSDGWTPLVGQPWTPTLGSAAAPRPGVSEVLVTINEFGEAIKMKVMEQ